MVTRLVRLLAVTVLLGAVSRGVWWLVTPVLAPVPDLLDRPGHLPLEQALAIALAATLLAGWLWCVLTAGLLSLELTVRGAPRQARALPTSARCPAPVRAVVLAVLGGAGAAGTLTVPAHADGLVAPAPRPAAAVVGLAVPDRQAAAVAGTPPGAVHVVRPGESLWSIAESRLPAGASAALVDRDWRRLYAANRRTVGPDPDLIRPGTSLGLPHHLQPRKDAR